VRRLAGSGRRISNRDYGCNALTERDRRRALSLCQSAPAFPLIHTETRLDLFAATGWCVRGLPLMAGLGRFLLLRLPGCPAGLLSNRDLPASGCRHNALGFGCSSISPARFLREALPGHQYQLSIQRARSDLPNFRRFGADPAFAAGWGSYAASLGEELGVYRETSSKFEALLGQLECAAGLVIDTGLHAQGWTRQRAIDYLHSKLPLDETGVRRTVDRAIALPAEALACTIGERKIQALRRAAEQRLGARFDVRAFHAQLLGGGAVPIDILESNVLRWLGGLQ